METQVDRVVSLWRYPVKSMMGEELSASEVTERGLVGDRQFALRDRETGKVVGAKNPRRWGNFFGFGAAFVEPPQSGSTMPAVRITLPDGTAATSGEDDLANVGVYADVVKGGTVRRGDHVTVN
jgi:uncharacterized protein YcbX